MLYFGAKFLNTIDVSSVELDALSRQDLEYPNHSVLRQGIVSYLKGSLTYD